MTCKELILVSNWGLISCSRMKKIKVKFFNFKIENLFTHKQYKGSY